MPRMWESASDLITRIEERQQLCEDIASYARRRGLPVTAGRVNRKFTAWRDWYYGRLSTGRLMNITGVRKEKPHGTDRAARS